jgi:hypothetical protein
VAGGAGEASRQGLRQLQGAPPAAPPAPAGSAAPSPPALRPQPAPHLQLGAQRLDGRAQRLGRARRRGRPRRQRAAAPRALLIPHGQQRVQQLLLGARGLQGRAHRLRGRAGRGAWRRRVGAAAALRCSAAAPAAGRRMQPQRRRPRSPHAASKACVIKGRPRRAAPPTIPRFSTCSTQASASSWQLLSRAGTSLAASPLVLQRHSWGTVSEVHSAAAARWLLPRPPRLASGCCGGLAAAKGCSGGPWPTCCVGWPACCEGLALPGGCEGMMGRLAKRSAAAGLLLAGSGSLNSTLDRRRWPMPCRLRSSCAGGRVGRGAGLRGCTGTGRGGGEATGPPGGAQRSRSAASSAAGGQAGGGQAGRRAGSRGAPPPVTFSCSR